LMLYSRAFVTRDECAVLPELLKEGSRADTSHADPGAPQPYRVVVVLCACVPALGAGVVVTGSGSVVVGPGAVVVAPGVGTTGVVCPGTTVDGAAG